MAACCGVPPYTPGPAARDRGHRGHGVDAGGHHAGPAPAPEPPRGPRTRRLGAGPARRPGERRGRRPLPGPRQARPGTRADRQSMSSSTPRTCSRRCATRWSARAADHHLLLGLHRPDRSTGPSPPGACSPRRGTGTWTPGARWPVASAASGSTGSPRPRLRARRRPRCWPSRRPRRRRGEKPGSGPSFRDPTADGCVSPPTGPRRGCSRPSRQRSKARRTGTRSGRSSSPAMPGWSGCCSVSDPGPTWSSPVEDRTLAPEAARRILARYQA